MNRGMLSTGLLILLGEITLMVVTAIDRVVSIIKIKTIGILGLIITGIITIILVDLVIEIMEVSV